MSDDLSIKNIIAKSLGAFWILDGLLQLQPLMFGQDFVTNVLTPTLSNQPAFLHVLIMLGIQAWNTNTLFTNAAAALLQTSIGLLLLFPLSDVRFKIGAYISIVWGLIIWIFGEGMGLLLTGSASFYTGAPGAVLVYVLLALLLLMPEKVESSYFPKIAGWILILGSALQLQPLFWTFDGVQQAAMASSMEVVPVLSKFPAYLSNLLAINPVAANFLLIGMPLCIGIALLLRPNRITASTALAFLLLIWWLGQDFGQLTALFTGTPTDPQLSPIVALLLIPSFVRFERKELRKKHVFMKSREIIL